MQPDNKNEKQPQHPPRKRISLMWGALTLLGIILLPLVYKWSGDTVQYITWPEFERNILSKGAVEKVEYTPYFFILILFAPIFV